MLLFILITVATNQLQSGNFIRSDWGAHQIVLHHLNSTGRTNYTKTLQNYDSGGVYSYNNPSVALALSGFILQTPNFFSYKTNVTYLTTSNNISIQIILLNSTSFTQLSFFILIVTPQSQNYLEMIAQCFNHTGQKMNHNISTKFNTTTGLEIIFEGITSVQITKNDDQSMYFSIYKVNNGDSWIYIQINSQEKQMNELCGVIIVTNQSRQIDQSAMPIEIFRSEWDSNIQSNFSIDNKYGPIYNKKCAIIVRSVEYQQYQNQPRLKYLVTSPGITNHGNNNFLIILKTLCILGKCLNQFYYNSSNNSCRRCSQDIPQCTKCSSIILCHSCTPHFVLSDSASSCINCRQFIPDCEQCQSSKCLKCNPGYVLSNLTECCMFCNIAIPNCLQCNSSEICFKCAPGFIIQNSKCLECLQGFYVNNTNNSCILCNSTIQYCKNCQTSIICVQCNSGFTVSDNNSCVSCDQSISNCTECSSLNTCLNCSGDLIASGHICLKCNQFISFCTQCNQLNQCLNCSNELLVSQISGQCVLCNQSIPNCSLCLQNNTCINCNFGLLLAQQGKKCLVCNQVVSSCIQCQSQECLNCSAGYYLRSKMICQKYECGDINCQLCDKQIYLNHCLLCQSGYILSNKQCLDFSSQQQLDSICMTGILISLIVLFIIISRMLIIQYKLKIDEENNEFKFNDLIPIQNSIKFQNNIQKKIK